jgi:hypothetical protein
MALRRYRVKRRFARYGSSKMLGKSNGVGSAAAVLCSMPFVGLLIGAPLAILIVAGFGVFLIVGLVKACTDKDVCTSFGPPDNVLDAERDRRVH